MNLINKRNEINEIDRQMAVLFERRMQVVNDIFILKQNAGLPIYDAARENEMLAANLKHIKNQEYKKYYQDFLFTCLKISKNYMQDLNQR